MIEVATTAWGALADPLGEEFMRRALLEVTLIGVAGGALGCWIVLYGLSYAAESLAHSLFPGLVVAALAGIPLLAGGAPGIVVAAVAIALVGRVPAIGRDTAVAVVVTTLFGLGALLALSPNSPPGLQSLLFGDILGPSDGDLIMAGALALTIVAALGVLHPRLLAAGFDRSVARSLGIPSVVVDVMLLVLMAAAILVAVQGLGNLLVVAVLVGPAATARLLSERILSMMVLAAAIAIVCGTAGLYLSYYAGTAAGASVAGAMVVAYLVAAAGRGGRFAAAAVPS